MNKIDTLCVIDDDEAFRFLTKLIVEETNLVNEIMFFPTGFEAINFFKSTKNDPKKLPEIILLDLNMPVMDGWEFLNEYIGLKPEIGKKITTYIVSSSINPLDIQKAKSIREVKDFVIKPITQETFEEMVQNIDIQ